MLQPQGPLYLGAGKEEAAIPAAQVGFPHSVEAAAEMSMSGEVFRSRAFHVLPPFLMALFPVLALLGSNIDQAEPQVAWRSLFLALVGAGLLLALLTFVMKNLQQASLLSTLILAVFFTYGHVYRAMEGKWIPGFRQYGHWILMGLALGLIGMSLRGIRKGLGDRDLLVGALNVALLAALVYPLVQIAGFQLRVRSAFSESPEALDEIVPLQASHGQELPDVYYIILDAYAREDVLQEKFHLDNAPFLESLRDRGFYVAAWSQSNYAQTVLSLASSLNLDYLQELGEFPSEGEDLTPMKPLVQRSAVRLALEGLGYDTVSFENGYPWTEVKDASYFLSKGDDAFVQMRAFAGLNAFEAMLLRTTAARVLTDASESLPRLLVPDSQYPFKGHSERVLYALDNLGRVPSIQGPTFTFAHLVIPHRPYVFGPDGELLPKSEPFSFSEEEVLDEESFLRGYKDQVLFLNGRLIEMVDSILKRSRVPPIIILQADHGPVRLSAHYRLAILNAYYFPDGEYERLYDTISPVNTFRVVFGQYFGAELPLLEDVSYLSSYAQPYDFIRIPNPHRPSKGE